MEKLSARSGTERVEAIAEYTFDLLEVHEGER